jgi:hypothetical protein
MALIEVLHRSHKMKKQEKRLKPRNPLVAQAMFMKAGWKEKSTKAQRRGDKVALRQGKSKDFFQTAPMMAAV